MKKEKLCSNLPGIYYFSPKLHSIICLNFEVVLNDENDVKARGSTISRKMSKKIDVMMKKKSRLNSMLGQKPDDDDPKPNEELFKSISFEFDSCSFSIWAQIEKTALTPFGDGVISDNS